MTDLDARHRALLQTLVEHRVDFVLVGGVALQVHGYSGATRDVDYRLRHQAREAGDHERDRRRR